MKELYRAATDAALPVSPMIDFGVGDNVSALDLLASKIKIFNANNLKVVLKTTKNWMLLPSFYFSRSKRFTARFRDGEARTYENPSRYFNDAVIKYISQSKIVKVRKGLVEFTYSGKKVLLAGGIGLGAELVLENFVNDQYSWLDVEKKVVLDLGANIGDTGIYFALRGAAKVYALEPYPYTYEIAKENVGLNGMSGIIEVVNEGCSSKDGFITLDPKFKNMGNVVLRPATNGKRIKMRSLDWLVKRYRLKDAILKMDCEGYEYEIILNSKAETLRRFDQIMLEYHCGYINIARKLRESGFAVKHTIPIYIPNRQLSDYGLLEGAICAARV